MKTVLIIFLGLSSISSLSQINQQKNKTEAGVCVDCDKKNVEEIKGSNGSQRFLPLKDFIQKNSKISDESKTMIKNFTNAGLICDETNPSRGDRAVECKGIVLPYEKTVRIYIPRNLKNSKQISKANYFFHGFKSNQTFEKNINDLNGAGDFAGIVEKSKSENSILIVPESDGQCTDYKKIINNSKVFTDLQAEIERKSGAQFLQNTLSGHSGAYLTIDALLKNSEIRKKIKSIALFDSIYDSQTSLPGVRSWLELSTQNKIKISYVTGSQESTRLQTQKFLSRTVKNENQINVQTLNSLAAGAHMSAMQKGGFSDFLKD